MWEQRRRNCIQHDIQATVCDADASKKWANIFILGKLLQSPITKQLCSETAQCSEMERAFSFIENMTPDSNILIRRKSRYF